MYSKEELCLIYLVRCVLEQKKAKYDENVNYSLVFALGLYHGVANLTYYAISQFRDKLDNNLIKNWSEVRDKEVVKDITQEVELANLEAEFNSHQIKYVLLKGALLKKLYPQSDMRTMGDIDILIAKENQYQAKQIMEGLGYTTKEFNKSNEDVYYKEPIMNVEIHTELFNKKSSYYHYYENVSSMLVKDQNYRYKFTDEDFYLFLITHMAKHYFHTGTGLRSLIDIYLYNQTYQLDRTYLDKKLKEFELLDFEQDTLKLIANWFAGQKSSKDLDKMGKYILESGKYGKSDNVINNRMEEYQTKNTYFLKRLFLSKKEMQKHYPILNKIPFLLPGFWLYRLLESIIKKPRAIFQEVKEVIKYPTKKEPDKK